MAKETFAQATQPYINIKSISFPALKQKKTSFLLDKFNWPALSICTGQAMENTATRKMLLHNIQI
ncbi:hypothetical protein [Leucothrix arctica]|uniref:Uncharacterized protein n=1 Tax=Leucothrix arctica TaxID=1481894 RepID=A0A317CI50_9GAMM|nr:hypothetical protein [Leucothrix arctica]PWQ97947.1 hypothetical protein DKT75_05640 [Leucothrix arctica]